MIGRNKLWKFEQPWNQSLVALCRPAAPPCWLTSANLRLSSAHLFGCMHHRLFSVQGSLGEVYLHAVTTTKCWFPMLHRAQPLWYRADSPELLQGSSVLLLDKGTRMVGCSFLCSLSQATGSFWWYWICCLRQVQDSRSNNSHPLRQESGLAGKRNLQRIDWKRVLHSILILTTSNNNYQV